MRGGLHSNSGWVAMILLAASDIATAASGLRTLATKGLALVASDMPTLLLAASDLATAASDIPSLSPSTDAPALNFLATHCLEGLVFNLCSISPGSHTHPCGRLRGVLPYSSYFLILSRCARANVRNASGSLSMVARTVLCKLSSKLCRSMLYLYSAINLSGAYQFYRSLRRSLDNHTSLDRNPNPKQNRSLGIEFWVAGINSKSRDCPENPSWPTRQHAGLRSSCWIIREKTL